MHDSRTVTEQLARTRMLEHTSFVMHEWLAHQSSDSRLPVMCVMPLHRTTLCRARYEHAHAQVVRRDDASRAAAANN